VPEAETSPEHILPLSLGGDDRLTLRVDGRVNRQLGHDIDGPNDFLLARKRAEYHARGHSREEPQLVANLECPTTLRRASRCRRSLGGA